MTDIVNVFFGTELPALVSINAASDSHGSFSGVTRGSVNTNVVICGRFNQGQTLGVCGEILQNLFAHVP
jgi:hypothetical protein